MLRTTNEPKKPMTHKDVTKQREAAWLSLSRELRKGSFYVSINNVCTVKGGTKKYVEVFYYNCSFHSLHLQLNQTNVESSTYHVKYDYGEETNRGR